MLVALFVLDGDRQLAKLYVSLQLPVKIWFL